jgi:predicted DNA binding CopG/RHH family protein
MSKIKLDSYEKGILQSYDKGEWKQVNNMAAEIKKHQKYARSTFKKDRRINIRISSKDLEDMQKRALQEGIPYQTLVSSVIHKYVSGSLTERRV